jgi:L-alanine-DL-glutamate epimerase-like enolase superfamily enzyme
MGVPVGAKVADEMTALAEDFRDEVAMQLDPNCTWSQPVQPTQNLNQSSLRLAS